jgi:hypothetical protein
MASPRATTVLKVFSRVSISALRSSCSACKGQTVRSVLKEVKITLQGHFTRPKKFVVEDNLLTTISQKRFLENFYFFLRSAASEITENATSFPSNVQPSTNARESHHSAFFFPLFSKSPWFTVRGSAPRERPFSSLIKNYCEAYLEHLRRGRVRDFLFRDERSVQHQNTLIYTEAQIQGREVPSLFCLQYENEERKFFV